MKHRLAALGGLVFALSLALGTFAAPNALAFVNGCVPQSACTALPGDCGGTALAQASNGGTAQVGSCGAGNSATALAGGLGYGGGNASVGVINAPGPNSATATARGAGANVSLSLDSTGSASGSVTFAGGQVSAQANQSNGYVERIIQASRLGSGSGSFTVSALGQVSVTCSGSIEIQVQTPHGTYTCLNGHTSLGTPLFGLHF